MLIVVGGHSRNIGKTSVVAGLIQALPQWDWTAMKITQFGHGICSASGTGCDCCLAPEHPYAIAEERHPGHSDTGRFLAAGARRSYWVRTATGQLENALPAVREVRAAPPPVGGRAPPPKLKPPRRGGGGGPPPTGTVSAKPKSLFVFLPRALS